jgi:hypothetical protein
MEPAVLIMLLMLKRWLWIMVLTKAGKLVTTPTGGHIYLQDGVELAMLPSMHMCVSTKQARRRTRQNNGDVCVCHATFTPARLCIPRWRALLSMGVGMQEPALRAKSCLEMATRGSTWWYHSLNDNMTDLRAEVRSKETMDGHLR